MSKSTPPIAYSSEARLATPAESLLERLFLRTDVLSQGRVDQGLVATPASCVNLSTKPVE